MFGGCSKGAVQPGCWLKHTLARLVLDDLHRKFTACLLTGLPLHTLACRSTTLSLSFVDQPVVSPMVVVLTPVLSSSVGQLYFQPSQAYILNSTTKVPAVVSSILAWVEAVA